MRISYDSSTLEAGVIPMRFFRELNPVASHVAVAALAIATWVFLNRSAVEKMAPKVAFSKQEQLAQETVGSRDHCTSRVCSGLVGGVAQGCNIRSPAALA